MRIDINTRSETRVRDAVARRAELLRANTEDMTATWLQEMRSVETTIAAAVAHAMRAQQP